MQAMRTQATMLETPEASLTPLSFALSKTHLQNFPVAMDTEAGARLLARDHLISIVIGGKFIECHKLDKKQPYDEDVCATWNLDARREIRDLSVMFRYYDTSFLLLSSSSDLGSRDVLDASARDMLPSRDLL
jgi:hypothetical protein